jgi:long-chain acyl-CoA synthetase
MMENACAFNMAAGLGDHTRMYHCLPKTHMAGFLNTILCPTLAGGTVVFGPTFSARTAASFWDDLIDSGANTVWLTPTMAAMIMRIDRRPNIAQRPAHVFCGTAPLSRKLREKWLKTYHMPLQESYGTSEQMLISVQSYEQALEEHNCGSLIPGMEVETAKGGELIVNGTPTGDIGSYRDDRLIITGRIKDLIIRGGYNVSPLMVEEAARKAEGVRDAAVVGKPHDFWGEAIVLFAEGGDKATISEHCKSHLPKSHWPDVIEIVDRLPKNEMGKVLKRELR